MSKEIEPCLRGQCRAPLACSTFGFCRVRNIESAEVIALLEKGRDRPGMFVVGERLRTDDEAAP